MDVFGSLGSLSYSGPKLLTGESVFTNRDTEAAGAAGTASARPAETDSVLLTPQAKAEVERREKPASLSEGFNRLTDGLERALSNGIERGAYREKCGAFDAMAAFPPEKIEEYMVKDPKTGEMTPDMARIDREIGEGSLPFLLGMPIILEGQDHRNVDNMAEKIDVKADHAKQALRTVKNGLQSFVGTLFGEGAPERKNDAVEGILDQKTLDFFKSNPEYAEGINKRYAEADPQVRALYDKMKYSIRVDDIEGNTEIFSSGNSFEPVGNQVSSSRKQELEIIAECNADPEKVTPGLAYYHEVGHLIDDRLEADGAATDKNTAFRQAIDKDVNAFVDNYMKENGITDRKAAYKSINDMMSGDDAINYAPIGDIFSGVTSRDAEGTKDQMMAMWTGDDSSEGLQPDQMDYVQGKRYHMKHYWDQDENRVSSEAFANMFETYMGGTPQQRELMERILPTATVEFKNMVQEYTK